MYRAEIDLVVWYSPPMEDAGRGIRLTQTVELPFPLTEDVSLHSREWEGIDDPLGCTLKNIVWDIDRSCFLAETHLGDNDVPIAMIPVQLHGLIQNGWRYGSYRDSYGRDRKRRSKRKPLQPIKTKSWDWDEAVEWDSNRRSGRPKEYKVILQSIVSTMAELLNNLSTAYAML